MKKILIISLCSLLVIIGVLFAFDYEKEHRTKYVRYICDLAGKEKEIWGDTPPAITITLCELNSKEKPIIQNYIYNGFIKNTVIELQPQTKNLIFYTYFGWDSRDLGGSYKNSFVGKSSNGDTLYITITKNNFLDYSELAERCITKPGIIEYIKVRD